MGLNHEALFKGFSFHPVIRMPREYDVYDFSQGYDAERPRRLEYGIGKYNEARPDMYTTELFKSGIQPRNIHIGVDLAAPVGTPVHAFFAGEIFLAGINPAAGDYGGTVITQHQLGSLKIWALFGHLSHASVAGKKPGEKVNAGDVIGWLGNKLENGGWNPHVHFQLSLEKPEKCDLPGAVTKDDLAHALEVYPDPRLVIGPLY
jgi:murein DD-endopeptidase MepM/ murein hydrolase activator NlpD